MNIVNGIITSDDLQTLKEQAIDKVAIAVTGTMGPNGNYALIEHGGRPKVTKDGVSVAKGIKFEDRTMDLVAQVITEASIRTDKDCGDGTTTTVFLTKAFYDKFKTHNTFAEKLKMDKLLKEVLAFIDQRTIIVTPKDNLLQELALTTSNNDPVIVDNVLSIYDVVKGNPDIQARRGVDGDDRIEFTDGVQFPGGYADPSFSPQGQGTRSKFKNAQGVIFNNKVEIDIETNLSPLLEVMKENPGPLILAAKEFDRTALQIISMLRSKHNLDILPVIINAIGSAGAGILGDLALVVNGRADNVMLDFPSWVAAGYSTKSWGEVEIGGSRITVSNISDETTALIKERTESIEAQIKDMPIEQQVRATANMMRRRISNLLGGQATIVVGGEMDSDIKERYDRYVDVIRAVKSALTNGVLPGIGYTLALAGVELLKNHPDDIIAEKFADVLGAQLEFLTGERYREGMTFTNLATNDVGKTPMEIGVWDAKLATVTALKAGLKTALILTSIHATVLGPRSAAV